MKSPGYIVTGANTGIGKAIAQGLAERGLRVIMLCRDSERGTHAFNEIRTSTNNDLVELVIGDLSSSGRVRSVAKTILDRVPEIVVLINNAGVWPTQLEHNEEGIEMSFAVNHLAPFLLSHLLFDRLKQSGSGRIVNISASLYSRGKIDLEGLVTGEGFSPFSTYATTKLCNVLFTREFSRRYKGCGVTINSVHPGVVRTNLVSNMSGLLGKFLRLSESFGKSPVGGAEGPIFLSTSVEVNGTTGCFFNGRKKVSYAKSALNNEISEKLWEKSERLTGL